MSTRLRFVLALPLLAAAPFLFFAGVPLLIVGTYMLAVHLCGEVWWVGVLLAPVVIIEFAGGLSFSMWLGKRAGDWAGL